MSWWEVLLLMLASAQLMGIGLMVWWLQRMADHVTAIHAYLDVGDAMLDEDDGTTQDRIISPDQVPMSKHLHDVIAQPPMDDDGKVGEFQGHLPWTPPPDKDNIE